MRLSHSNILFLLQNALNIDVLTGVKKRSVINLQACQDKIGNLCIAKIASSDKFVENTKSLEETDVCPICYLDFPDIKNLLSCPTCKNYVHDDCMNIWLKHAKTCVYCRSDIWKDYYVTISNKKN